jgi:AcrR family transcriptional regulator
VDAIADRAGVSRRTFFNYYSSKEDAVLGTTVPVVPEEALRAFIKKTSDVDQFTRTVRFPVAVVRSTIQAHITTPRSKAGPVVHHSRGLNCALACGGRGSASLDLSRLG